MSESRSMSSLIRVLVFMLLACLVPCGCGRKGDPLPRFKTRPAACLVRWISYRVLEVTLPDKDEFGHSLLGIDKVRVYYLPLNYDRPTGDAIIARGQVIMERSQPAIADLKEPFRLDLKQLNYSSGWLTVVAVRVGDVIGVPSETLVWLDSSI